MPALERTYLGRYCVRLLEYRKPVIPAVTSSTLQAEAQQSFSLEYSIVVEFVAGVNYINSSNRNLPWL